MDAKRNTHNDSLDAHINCPLLRIRGRNYQSGGKVAAGINEWGSREADLSHVGSEIEEEIKSPREGLASDDLHLT